MAIRITHVTKGAESSDSVIAHTNLDNFHWVDEKTQQTGTTNLANMYDWIVNKKGQAYIKDSNNDMVYIFGATSPADRKYIRAAKNGAWTNDLLDLPS